MIDFKHPVAIIGEQEAGRSAKVRGILESLVKSIQKSTFDVAELLAETKHNGYYAPDYDSMKEYVKSIGMKVRKAQYLIRIVDVMNEVKIPRDKYEPIGIAKLREITSLEPSSFYFDVEKNENIPMHEFITALVEKAPELDLEVIKEQVKILKGLIGENELVWLNISLKREALDKVVRPALDLAKANIGSVVTDEDGNSVDASDGRALEAIAIEFLNDPSNQYREENL